VVELYFIVIMLFMHTRTQNAASEIGTKLFLCPKPLRNWVNKGNNE